MAFLSISKLYAALLVAVVLLAGCASLGDLDGVVPSQAFYEVTVRAEGPGRLNLEQFQLDCNDACTVDIPVGTVLHPQAVEDEGGRFWYWGGSCSGAEDCTVLVDSDIEIVAVFQEADGGTTTAPGDDGRDDAGAAGDDTGGNSGQDDGGDDAQNDSGGSDETGGAGDQDDSGGTSDDSGDSGDAAGADDPGDDDGTPRGPGSDGHYFLTFGVRGPGGGQVEIPAIDFVCTGECGHNGLPDEKVNLKAVADDGSFFFGWTGACEGSGELCTVTMDEDDETFALFRLDDKPLLLTVAPVPDGGTVRGGDIDCGDDGDSCASDHASGDSIALRAEPAAEFEFTGWTGACAGSEAATCEFTIGEDVSVSAIFEGQVPMHELTVEIEGIVPGEILFPNGVSCEENETCDEHFPAGSEVTLEAMPDEGYIDGWEGTDCEPHASTCTVLMDRDRFVSVSFHTSDLEFILTIEKPTGGTIIGNHVECGDAGNDCTSDYAFDDVEQLRAVPAQGFEFGSWDGDCSDSETPVCDLVFRDNKAVSATFREE